MKLSKRTAGKSHAARSFGQTGVNFARFAKFTRLRTLWKQVSLCSFVVTLIFWYITALRYQ